MPAGSMSKGRDGRPVSMTLPREFGIDEVGLDRQHTRTRVDTAEREWVAMLSVGGQLHSCMP